MIDISQKTEDCLNYICVVSDSGKQYCNCCVFMSKPSKDFCDKCTHFISLDGVPCHREESKE